MSEGPAAPPLTPHDRRDAVLHIIRDEVRLRFRVSAQCLADRLIEIATASDVDPIAQARRTRLDDLYLALACASGDEDAWKECAASHFAFIRSFARKFLPDAAARDLADEVIADLWQRQKIGRYAGRSTLRTWLGAVVAHAAINAAKSPPPTQSLETAEFRNHASRQLSSGSGDGREAADAGRVLADLVAEAVEALGPEEKLLLQLYYEQGLTLDEMEIVVRSSKATLSRRLKRIREALKRSVDALAARRLGTSAVDLRDRLSLDRLELDLSAVLGGTGTLEGQRRNDV